MSKAKSGTRKASGREKERTPIEEYEDRVVAGFLALYPQSRHREHELRRRMGFDLRPLLELNSRFPADLLPLSLALNAIDDHFACVLRLPTKRDVKFVLDLLPEACREVSVRITPNILISGNWGKHSSVYWEVRYKGLGLPFRMEAKRFADMDDLGNHSCECPQLYDEESEEYSDDCCCEAEVVEEGVLELGKSDIKDEGHAKKLVSEFLQKTIGC